MPPLAFRPSLQEAKSLIFAHPWLKDYSSHESHAFPLQPLAALLTQKGFPTMFLDFTLSQS
jgi:hypothetical protein